jgi:DNA-binding NarL/FixJ family response regulator
MSKIRTVIIEDDELTRLYICKALQQKDQIEVVGEAHNARRGLIILKKLRPDVAIVDIGLPDKDGIELTREIKVNANYYQLLKTRVLILTSYHNQESVLAAFKAGADSYCTKNTQFNNLVEAIQVTADGNPWIDPIIARIVLEQARQKNSFKSNDHQSFIDPNILTNRELEVLQLVVDGCGNNAIADKLYITNGTVKTHISNIMKKLCANDRTQAAVIAMRHGLIV